MKISDRTSEVYGKFTVFMPKTITSKITNYRFKSNIENVTYRPQFYFYHEGQKLCTFKINDKKLNKYTNEINSKHPNSKTTYGFLTDCEDKRIEKISKSSTLAKS